VPVVPQRPQPGCDPRSPRTTRRESRRPVEVQWTVGDGSGGSAKLKSVALGRLRAARGSRVVCGRQRVINGDEGGSRPGRRGGLPSTTLRSHWPGSCWSYPPSRIPSAAGLPQSITPERAPPRPVTRCVPHLPDPDHTRPPCVVSRWSRKEILPTSSRHSHRPCEAPSPPFTPSPTTTSPRHSKPP